MRIIKLKFLVLFMIIYLYNLKINILFKLSKIDIYYNREINFFYYYYLKLKEIKNTNNFNFLKKKLYIIKEISKNNFKKNISTNNIFLSSSCRFGNCIIYLNKYISICEIIGCNSILLDKNNFWFIKKNITLKNGILIKIGDKKKFNKYLKCDIKFNDFFMIKPEIKTNLLRNEIIRNLPKIKLSASDLYIHIRSDDIFKFKNIENQSTQPPLCFFYHILDNFKFLKIYIISSDEGNPVITKLIKNYPILFLKNNLDYDISTLINAFNIVGSSSSFFTGILQLNYNIKYLWDYNFFEMRIKNMIFHYDLYKYPQRNFIIYRMEPTKIYKKVLFNWKNNKKQRKLMLKDKCDNNFRIILK